jgi:hypothetical protein
LTAFCRTVEDQWQRLTPGWLLTAGSLSHLE